MDRDRVSFKVGTTVEWTSQSGGYTRTKCGDIVEVVPAGHDPRGEYLKSGVIHWGPAINRRTHESYVVEVRRHGARGKKLKPHYYWPHASQLEEVPF